MPALIQVTVEALDDIPLFLESSGRAAQSLLLNALTLVDPELSDRLKEGGEGAPPYSVGRIIVPREIKVGPRGYVVLGRGSEARFFVGVADDSLTGVFLRALRGELELSKGPVRLSPTLLRSTSYEELLTSDPAREISFRTRNPLVLGRVSRGDYPEGFAEGHRLEFPRWNPWDSPLNPAHLLNLPLRAWAAHAPQDLRVPGSLIRVLERLEVARVDLRWARTRLPVGGRWEVVPGYEGEVRLSAGGLDTFTGSLVAGLARLAEFTGLGSRTTHGFGSVSVRFLGR